MSYRNIRTYLFCLMLLVVPVVLLLAACGAPAAAPTRTPELPTATAIPPTATPIPATQPPPTTTPNPTPRTTGRVPGALFPGEGFLEIGEFSSEALADNLIGDTTTRLFYVYLPPGYDDTSKRYPVVYVLHGYTGHAGGPWIQEMARDLDRQITNGEAPSMILVSPDAYNVFGGSWYMSSPTIGDYETYITQELVDLIDANYRTIPHRDSRGITGCSMGGDGSMHLALTYPDVFSVVAGVSGLYDYENESDPVMETARSRFKGNLSSLAEVNKLSMEVQNYLAAAAATAPNPDNPPLYLDMPFEMVSGESQIVPDVIEKIVAADPMHDVHEYLDQPVRLRGAMIYTGASDLYSPVEVIRAFDQKLTDLNVEHDYLEVPGGHCDLPLEPVIQFMADHLVHETADEVIETGSPTASLASETVVEIEALVEQTMTDSHIPGLAIGVVKDGALVYVNGFGVANLDTGEPVTPQTVFPLAEMAMTPTAIAILQLAEAGIIDLDAPITDYLPYFEMADERYTEITVGDVLASRSGIRQIGHGAMADWANLASESDEGALERWVRSLADERLLFAPGQGFEYTNRGYALLGDVIAKVSGQSYESYVQDNILTPLGMNQSTSLLDDVDLTSLVSMHVLNDDGEMVVAEHVPYYRPFAAGNNFFSNVEDMAKLAQASLHKGELDGERILSEAGFDLMLEPHSTAYGDQVMFGTHNPSSLMQDWGYSWFLGEVSGHPAYDGGGQESGLLNVIVVVPDESMAVIAMGNAPVVNAYYTHDIAVDVMGMLLNQ